MTKNRRHLKYLLVFLAGCLLFAAMTIALLPTLASTAWGQKKVISLINKRIPGHINAQHIHLSWFGGQSVETAELTDQNGKIILGFQTLKTDIPLWRWLLRGSKQGNIAVEGFHIALIEEFPGVTNLHKALNSKFLSEKLSQFNTAKTPLEISLEGVTASIDFAKAAPLPFIKAHGISRYNNTSGEFSIDYSQNAMQASVNKFPVAFLDYLLSLKNPRLASLPLIALGDIVDMNFTNQLIDETNNFTLSVQSPHFSTNLSGILEKDTIHLSKPSPISLTVSPKLIDILSKAARTPLAFNLDKPSQATATIHRLSLPLSFFSDTQTDTNQLVCHADLSLSEAEIIHQIRDEKVALQHFHAQLNANENLPFAEMSIDAEAVQRSQPVQLQLKAKMDKPYNSSAFPEAMLKNSSLRADLNAPVALLDKLFGSKTFYRDLLGQHMRCTLQGQCKDQQKSMQIALESDNAILPAVNFAIDDQVILTQPATLSYKLTPFFVQESDFIPDFLDLTKEATVELIVNKFSMPDLWDIKKSFIEAEVAAPSLALNLSQRHQGEVKNFLATVSGYPFYKMQCTIGSDFVPAFQGTLAKAFGDTLHFHANATLEQSEEKVWRFNPITANISNQTFNAKIESSFVPNQPGVLDISFQGNQLNGNLAFLIQDTIALRNPLNMTILMTPERFALLREFLEVTDVDALVLLEPATVAVKIDELDFPLDASFNIALAGDVSVDQFQVINRSRQRTAFNNIRLHINSKDIAENLFFKMVAEEKLSDRTVNALTVVGQADHLFTDDGAFNKQELSLQLEAKSPDLPASLLCRVACVEEDVRNKIEALFGETIKTDIKAHLTRMSGPIRAKLEGQNGRIDFEARLTNGVLTLEKPFVAEIQVTPKLGKSILEDFIPILGGVIAADNPIRITIHPEGFSYSLQSSDLSSVQFEQATIALGKMRFSNEGQLGEVLQLLKRSDHRDLSVWFTPLYMSMKEGKFKLERMDMLLLQRYPMALWGKVDFIKDKVDIRVGLTGTALGQALDIQGLEPDYMLQLPLRGKIGEASIDKTKAAARISSFIAQSQGSTHGMIIGTVLGIAGGSLSEDKTPPPTTNPLPWAELLSPSDQKEEKKVTLNHETLKETANSLFKTLFK